MDPAPYVSPCCKTAASSSFVQVGSGSIGGQQLGAAVSFRRKRAPLPGVCACRLQRR